MERKTGETTLLCEISRTTSSIQLKAMPIIISINESNVYVFHSSRQVEGWRGENERNTVYKFKTRKGNFTLWHLETIIASHKNPTHIKDDDFSMSLESLKQWNSHFSTRIRYGFEAKCSKLHMKYICS